MPYLDVYACIMLTHVQACLLSDVITSVNRDVLFRSHNAKNQEKRRKSALERLEGEGTFKSRALWSVREGKGLIGVMLKVKIYMPLNAPETRNFILHILPAGSDQEFSKQKWMCF